MRTVPGWNMPALGIPATQPSTAVRTRVVHRATDNPQENLGLLFDQWEQNAGERDYVATMRRWDDGSQIQDIPKMPNEQSTHQQRKPRWAPKLLSAMLDELSYLYATDPVRKASRPNRWRQALWQFRYQSSLDAIMLDADRSVRRDGTALAIAAPGSSTQPGAFVQPSEADGIDIFMRTRDLWEVLEHEDDSRSVGAALVWWSNGSIVTERGQRRVSDVFWYFDSKYQGRVEGQTFVSLDEHGYGLCPATTLRNEFPKDSPLGWPAGGQDQLNNLRTINRLMEEINWTGLLQRGQPVISGKYKGDSITLAPDSPWFVEEVGAVQFLANNANLDHMLRTLQMLLDTWAIGMGLPRSKFLILTTQFAQSAAVIQAQDTELTKDRKVRERIATVWEMDIARVASAVNNAIPGMPELSASPYAVEYTISPMPLTHADKLAEAKFSAERGLSDPFELKRQLQPHLSEDEARERVEAGMAHLKEMTEMAAQRAGHAGDTAAAGELGGDGERDEAAVQDDGVTMPVGDDAPSEAEAVAVATGAGVEKLALNGAQVTALQGVLETVALGNLEAVAAELMIKNAFPSIPESEVRIMVQSAASTEVPEPAQPEANQ